jgi:RNA polymerase sigma-70 factor (ECF subfamily)
VDEALVLRAQAGDHAARERLLASLQPVLRRFFRARAGDRPEVDDLIQNTLLRVHGSLDDLQRADRFKAFAMKAALFELQDLYRGRYSAKERLYDPDLPPADGARPDGGALRMDLERALEVLTPKARRIIELRELGYRYEEIADDLETTEAAVKMQVKRAFEKLRGVLTGFAVAVLTFSISPL